MKIVIVYHNFAHKGGAENVIYWLIGGLVNQGHSVKLVTRYYSDALWGPAEAFPCPVVRVQAKHITRYIRNLVMPFLLRRHLKEADVINAHNYPASVWTALAKRLFRLRGKLVCFYQEPNRALHYEAYDGCHPGITYQRQIFDDKTPSWFVPVQLACERRLDLYAARQMATVLVNSEYSRAQVDRILRVRSTVCTLGEPLDKIRYPEAAAAPRRYFLVLSRLHPAKNVGKILEAYEGLCKSRTAPPPPLVIAGDGMLLEPYQQWCAEHHLAGQVVFKGYVRDQDLPELFASAIVLIFVPIREPFGLVTVEAFLNGTPAIVSNDGGPAEVVSENETGFRVDPNDASAIAQKMAWFIDNPEAGRAMGIRAGREAQALFNQDAFISRFLKAVSG